MNIPDNCQILFLWCRLNPAAGVRFMHTFKGGADCVLTRKSSAWTKTGMDFFRFAVEFYDSSRVL